MTCFQQLIQILKENFILHRHNQLTVAEVSKENIKREMNEFLEQMKSDDMTFIFLTFKTIAFNELKVIIFSDEENENKNKNNSDD